MEYLLTFVSVTLGAFIGVTGALFLFKRVETGIEQTKSLINDLMQTEQEKTEFLEALSEEEEAELEFEQSPEGELMKELEKKKPWLFSRSKKKTR